jgi:hypothetical protein
MKKRERGIRIMRVAGQIMKCWFGPVDPEGEVDIRCWKGEEYQSFFLCSYFLDE